MRCHTDLPLPQDKGFRDVLALLCDPGGTEHTLLLDAACWTHRGFVLMEI